MSKPKEPTDDQIVVIASEWWNETRAGQPSKGVVARLCANGMDQSEALRRVRVLVAGGTLIDPMGPFFARPRDPDPEPVLEDPVEPAATKPTRKRAARKATK